MLGVVSLALLVTVVLVSLAGCSQQNSPGLEQPVRHSPPVELDQLKGKPTKMSLASTFRTRSLLFPPGAGLAILPARAFARADWPTTLGSYSLGETIYFQLRSYDHQRIGRYGHDYGYRRFVYSRAGVRYNY